MKTPLTQANFNVFPLSLASWPCCTGRLYWRERQSERMHEVYTGIFLRKRSLENRSEPHLISIKHVNNREEPGPKPHILSGLIGLWLGSGHSDITAQILKFSSVL